MILSCNKVTAPEKISPSLKINRELWEIFGQYFKGINKTSHKKQAKNTAEAILEKGLRDFLESIKI